MPKFDLVAFDLYGTVLDISGLTERMQPFLGEKSSEVLGAWRKAQLERTQELNRLAAYEPFDAVTAWALEQVAPQLDGATRNKLAELWFEVPPHKDAPNAFEALFESGANSAILSNGTRDMIGRALAASGLEVDLILTVDDVKAYKTDPRVYAQLDQHAPRGRTLFVSSNGWDVEGAKRSGRTVAWVDRGGEAPGLLPDYHLFSLLQVADVVRRK